MTKTGSGVRHSGFWEVSQLMSAHSSGMLRAICNMS